MVGVGHGWLSFYILFLFVSIFLVSFHLFMIVILIVIPGSDLGISA